jgi:hypothetical protein
LRKRLSEAEDLAGARAYEIAGLRERAQIAEANVKRMIASHPAGSLEREREQKELEAIMRARPGAYAGNVERPKRGNGANGWHR